MKTKLELTRENKGLTLLLQRERELNSLLKSEIDRLAHLLKEETK